MVGKLQQLTRDQEKRIRIQAQQIKTLNQKNKPHTNHSRGKNNWII